MTKDGNLNNADSVLSGKAEQHDQSDLRINVVLERETGETAKIESGKCSKNSDGYTQEHAKRKSPTFIESCENQETKKKREAEDHGRRHALLSPLLLVRHAEVVKSHI